jgi:uncharacterized repeat protein (TIGR04138 family)
MQAASFEEVLKQILAKDPRYPLNAYLFIREALDHTQKIIGKQAKAGLRHVTGQELLAGIRELALEQFGPMAMTVFEEWGIHSCRDFGEIVFNLVDHRVLARTEQDSRADFQNGYDFYEAFRKPFLPRNKVQSSGELPEPKATEA